MPNTKPIGVAFSDPELVAGTTITGATISGGTIANATITGGLATGLTTVSCLTLQSTGAFYIKTSTVAAAGTNQGTAAALSDGFNLVSAADGTKGVVLPAANTGRVIIIKNNAAATLKIYPAASDAINALAADASYDIAGLTSVILISYNTVTWYSIPLVAS